MDAPVEPSRDSSSGKGAAPSLPIVANAVSAGDGINDATDSEIRVWASIIAACRETEDVTDAVNTGDSVNNGLSGAGDSSSVTESDTESEIRAWALTAAAQRKDFLMVTPNNKVVSTFRHIYKYICGSFYYIISSIACA